jgi:hypothetical protein
LFASDGRLLDERPVAKRFEAGTIRFEDGLGGAPVIVTVGDPQPAPTAAEMSDAAEAATNIETQAREAAAKRRVSTRGELESYLLWRLSCRAGELLIADPYLLSPPFEATIAFLNRLDRPVRGVAPGIPEDARKLVDEVRAVEIRKLGALGKELHDRLWIVGETALLVGTSPGSFLPKINAQPGRATTISDLPHADAALWRGRFEDWWSKATP